MLKDKNLNAAQITQTIRNRLLDSQLMKDIENTSNLSQLYNMPSFKQREIKNGIVNRNNDELSGWAAEEDAPAEDMLPPNAITSPKMIVRIGQKGGKRSMNHRSLINELNSSSNE